MKKVIYLTIILAITSCQAQSESDVSNRIDTSSSETGTDDSLLVLDYYQAHVKEGKSTSLGSVSNGSIENAALMPFYGKNFQYFDINSYLKGRAFTHSTTKEIILNTYSRLNKELPERFFYLMELSHEHGGKIAPHRTHQNGTSVDFMMPKTSNGKIFYGLDTIGIDHYLLDFNNSGICNSDPEVSVDFNLIARHILYLDEEARKLGYKISKVIIKLEYKDDLYQTEYGKKIKERNIYFARNLSPLINKLHDDHFHVDFAPL